MHHFWFNSCCFAKKTQNFEKNTDPTLCFYPKSAFRDESQSYSCSALFSNSFIRFSHSFLTSILQTSFAINSRFPVSSFFFTLPLTTKSFPRAFVYFYTSTASFSSPTSFLSSSAFLPRSFSATSLKKTALMFPVSSSITPETTIW